MFSNSNNSLNNRDFNIDKNNHDHDFFSHNRAALHTMLVEDRGTATLTVLCLASPTWPSEAARPTLDTDSLDASSHSGAVHWKPSGLIFPHNSMH